MNQSCDIEALLDTANLLLVRPDPAFADKATAQAYEPDNALVGVLVRGPANDGGASGPGRDDALRRVRADLEYLIANGPVIAAEIGPMLDASRAIELKTAHVANLAELLTRVTNRFAHGDAVTRRALTVPSLRGDVPRREEPAATGGKVLPVAVLHRLIETTRTQLRLLTTTRDAQAAPTHDQVMLQTATGALRYTLPLSLDDTYSSTEVSEILSPTGKGHRTIAQNRRRANELLGVKVGSRYLGIRNSRSAQPSTRSAPWSRTPIARWSATPIRGGRSTGGFPETRDSTVCAPSTFSRSMSCPSG